MRSKRIRVNAIHPYELLNKHELRDLAERSWDYRPSRKMGFQCSCGCTEFLDLRDGFGECANCKAPYTVEDDRRNKVRRD